MEAIIVMAIIIGGSVALGVAINAIIEWYYNLIDTKRKKAHPDLWTWFDECDEAGSAECHYYNDNIAPLKRKIDNIIKNWNYYTAETKSQKEQELENLRKELETHELVYSMMCAETQKIRDKIHNYVEQHDLDWARQWGW